jgi:hypothetical protein
LWPTLIASCWNYRYTTYSLKNTLAFAALSIKIEVDVQLTFYCRI